MRPTATLLLAFGLALASIGFASAAEPCTATVVDPDGVVAPSSRLHGAIASLQRKGTTVRVTVDASSDAPVPCPGSQGSGHVAVELDTVERHVVVTASGDVSPATAARAEAIIQRRLHSPAPDVASAAAHGLEAIWWVQDRRRQREDALRTASDVQPFAARTQFSADENPRPEVGRGLAAVIRRVFDVVMTALATFTAAWLGWLGYRWRRRLLAARMRFRAARTSLAVRYVDLDVEVAQRLAALRGLPGSRTPDADDVEARVRAVRDAADDVGAMLLSSASGGRPRIAQAEELIERCDETRARLDDAVAKLAVPVFGGERRSG